MKQFIFLCVLCILLAGCGQRKPAGFPDVVPCQVSILKDGKPVDRTMVIFTPVLGGGSWITSAETDSNGRATLQTGSSSYVVPGSPVGEFKVVLSRPIKIERNVSQQEAFEMTEEQAATLEKKTAEWEAKARIIPETLESAVTTPVSITVSKDNPLHKIELNDYR